MEGNEAGKQLKRGGRVDRVGRSRLFTNERLQPKVFRVSVRSRMAQKGVGIRTSNNLGDVFVVVVVVEFK